MNIDQLLNIELSKRLLGDHIVILWQLIATLLKSSLTHLIIHFVSEKRTIVDTYLKYTHCTDKTKFAMPDKYCTT